MSGGSMDYFSYKMDEVAEEIPDVEIRALWKDLSELMHAIEWYTSGDTDIKDYKKAVSKFKKKWFKTEYPILSKQIITEAVNDFFSKTIFEEGAKK